MPRAKVRDGAKVEAVDTGDERSDAIILLRAALERALRGELTGVMVVCEMPDGGVAALMSDTLNVAERLGRIEILKDMVLEAAFEPTTGND